MQENAEKADVMRYCEADKDAPAEKIYTFKDVKADRAQLVVGGPAERKYDEKMVILDSSGIPIEALPPGKVVPAPEPPPPPPPQVPDINSPNYPISLKVVSDTLGISVSKLKELLRRCNISPKLYKHGRDGSLINCITKQEAGIFGAVLLEDPPRGVPFKVIRRLRQLVGGAI